MLTGECILIYWKEQAMLCMQQKHATKYLQVLSCSKIKKESYLQATLFASRSGHSFWHPSSWLPMERHSCQLCKYLSFKYPLMQTFLPDRKEVLNYHLYLMTYLLAFKYWKERDSVTKHQIIIQIIMRRTVLPAYELQRSLMYRKYLGVYNHNGSWGIWFC